ncbi:hypothetical protein SAMN03159353_10724 [Cedecea sp. NFIX57]|nr:hypothetical protein SAMN03159353_10724 [Cedecea sp. NFIX57]
MGKIGCVALTPHQPAPCLDGLRADLEILSERRRPSGAHLPDKRFQVNLPDIISAHAVLLNAFFIQGLHQDENVIFPETMSPSCHHYGMHISICWVTTYSRWQNR